MEIILLPQAEKDRDFWKKSGNKAIQKRISELLQDIVEHPFTGKGKPEALKHNLKGLWSRRINDEHRLVYQVKDDKLYVYVFSMRYHYSK